MIASIDGYHIFRAVSKSTLSSQLQTDLGKDAAICKEALQRKLPVYAVYRKTALKACYVFTAQDHLLTVQTEWKKMDFPADLQEKIDQEICRDLMDVLLRKPGYKAEFHNYTVDIRRKAFVLQIVEGILFGIFMGVVFNFALKQPAAAVIIGILWGVMSAILFTSHELRRQKDQFHLHLS
ncbi:MAG: hypothetical protein PUF49_10760 [Firmicutes bacterium]|nr:hypothetical protein [Bacillota bacterium]